MDVTSLLPAGIILLTGFSLVSAVILVRAALKKPYIGALTERALIAVLLAFFGIVYSIVVVNTEFGRTLFSTEIARVITRVAVIILLALPAYWVLLYLTGRLGGRE